MMEEDRGTLALEPQAAPRAASLLLHCLAVALFACIVALSLIHI